jgi:hypothetical protein
VNVRIAKAGQHQLAAQVDARGGGAGQRQHFSVGADGQDAP